jgi:hypothetical protein
MEKILAESLLEISRKTLEDCGIRHIIFLISPRRVYIETPGIFEVQELMKFSAYGRLVSRATRILDDINRTFLHGIPDIPCPGSWVRIIQAGIYKSNLALVVFTPSEGGIVSVAVVPRFDIPQTSPEQEKGGDKSGTILIHLLIILPSLSHLTSLRLRKATRCEADVTRGLEERPPCI